MTQITNQSKMEDKSQLIMEFQKIIEKSSVDPRKLEIPQYLICPITDDFMDEPVILASGFTYEKSSLKKHFEINGDHCPMTREWVDIDKLWTNNGIK